ncbi:S8 family serine peptidase [Okeania sp. SIO2B3]|uniref:S8 family serine peptidase n=1 Tax=Okeania sp. SIO2B3 TaxID=2607784 RepID=UPI0013C1D55F|nr:S8 family serine peptidase [Okeania sp. SIO2B3]NET41901.1 S8 family serine peptidase [Okeania sp. SIO2B3]
MVSTPSPVKNSQTQLDLREVLRHFTSNSSHPNRLRWHPALNKEDGAGMRVALLDSGISGTDSQLQSAQIQARDFTGSGGVFDPTGHGTKNARLLVAQGIDGFWGLVPASVLLVGKVLGTGVPHRGAEALAKGIRWAVYEKADVIIMPLGRIRGTTVVTKAVRLAIKAGCVVLAAAGNRGAETLLFPARLSDVIAVSAADINGQPLNWCCQMPQVNCYAPGLEIGVRGKSTSGSSVATVLAGGVETLYLASGVRRSLIDN